MEEPQEVTRVSTIGDLPSFSKAPSQPMGTLSEANLRAIDHIDPAADLAHRRRNLSNVSLSSVDRAMKKLGYEAENAALTSVAVGGSSLAAAEATSSAGRSGGGGGLMGWRVVGSSSLTTSAARRRRYRSRTGV